MKAYRVRLYDEWTSHLVPPDGIIVINTGLSVTVCGHIVDLDRDELRRVATVRVSVIRGHTVTGLEQADVKAAADMLAEQAQRFLGIGWTVVRWEPPTKAAESAG